VARFDRHLRSLQKGAEPPLEAFSRHWPHLALPDDQRGPSKRSETFERDHVALSVSLELRDPIFRPRARRFAAERTIMPVPKASMHQDDLPPRREDEIGRPWQITPVQTKPIAHAMNHPPNYKLRLRVALSD
jgi:hypothetical protein